MVVHGPIVMGTPIQSQVGEQEMIGGMVVDLAVVGQLVGPDIEAEEVQLVHT